MSKKTSLVRTAIPRPPRPADPVEAFVGGGGHETVTSDPTPAAPAEETKRLTIDITESLHKRLRLYAAGDGRRLADIVRELLDTNLPKA